MSPTEFLGVCATAILGAGGIDKLLLLRQKSALHRSMEDLWFKIEGLRPPEMASAAANWCLVGFHRIFHWRLFSWQTLMVSIIASFFVTSFCWEVGRALEDRLSLSFNSLPFYPAYLVNYVCDVATCMWALLCLKIIRNGRWLKAFAAIVSNIIVSALLGIFCLFAMDYLLTYAIYNNWPGTERFAIDPDIDHQVALASAWLKRDLKVGDREMARIDYRVNAQPAPLKIIVERLRADPLGYLAAPFERGFGSEPDWLIYTMSSDGDKIIGQDVIAGGDRKAPRVMNSGGGKTARHVMIPRESNGGPWSGFLTAASTFLPVFICGIVFVWMLMAKGVLLSARWGALLFLEKATVSNPAKDPKDFAPFTLLVTSLTIFAGFAKVVAALIVLILPHAH